MHKSHHLGEEGLNRGRPVNEEGTWQGEEMWGQVNFEPLMLSYPLNSDTLHRAHLWQNQSLMATHNIQPDDTGKFLAIMKEPTNQ